VAGQPKLAEMDVPEGFRKNDPATAYYNDNTKNRVFNFQNDERFTRIQCDCSFCPETELSTSNNITTPLDDMMFNFEARELKLASSFLLRKNDQYYFATLNTETKKLEIFTLGNE
jgi:hypothetical protein